MDSIYGPYARPHLRKDRNSSFLLRRPDLRAPQSNELPCIISGTVPGCTHAGGLAFSKGWQFAAADEEKACLTFTLDRGSIFFFLLAGPYYNFKMRRCVFFTICTVFRHVVRIFFRNDTAFLIRRERQTAPSRSVHPRCSGNEGWLQRAIQVDELQHPVEIA